MSAREGMLKLYLKNQEIVYEKLLSAGITYLTQNDVWTILQAELDLEYSEVIHTNLTAEKMLEVVYTHITRNGLALGKVALDIEVDNIEWITIVSDDLEKATVRNDGKIWVIHQNDADPHPSTPHAHNYQDHYKLDLYTGDLYEKTRCVGRLKKKELTAVVRKIKKDFPDIKFNK